MPYALLLFAIACNAATILLVATTRSEVTRTSRGFFIAALSFQVVVGAHRFYLFVTGGRHFEVVDFLYVGYSFCFLLGVAVHAAHRGVEKIIEDAEGPGG